MSLLFTLAYDGPLDDDDDLDLDNLLTSGASDPHALR